MEIWTAVLLFLLGLALIIKGGDWFLSGAVWIAEATGVPRFKIGRASCRERVFGLV